jgi:hypothetical protein
MNYSAAELHQKNARFPWINTKHVVPTNATYTLHATGDCTLQSGRIYVAVPSNVKINEETKKKYNIM